MGAAACPIPTAIPSHPQAAHLPLTSEPVMTKLLCPLRFYAIAESKGRYGVADLASCAGHPHQGAGAYPPGAWGAGALIQVHVAIFIRA